MFLGLVPINRICLYSELNSFLKFAGNVLGFLPDFFLLQFVPQGIWFANTFPTIHCVTLAKIFNLSVSWFPHSEGLL